MSLHDNDQPATCDIALLGSAMDKVKFNSSGNQVTLRQTKYAQSDDEAIEDGEDGI